MWKVKGDVGRQGSASGGGMSLKVASAEQEGSEGVQ